MSNEQSNQTVSQDMKKAITFHKALKKWIEHRTIKQDEKDILYELEQAAKLMIHQLTKRRNG